MRTIEKLALSIGLGAVFFFCSVFGAQSQTVTRVQNLVSPLTSGVVLTTGVSGSTLTATSGPIGYILKSTGTSTPPAWAATSTLGITSSQWITNGSNIYYTAGNVSIGTSTATEELTVQGDFNITNGTSKAYRFRTSGGGGLDLDFAGAAAYITTFPNVDFTGTQLNKIYMPTDSGSPNYQAGFWVFADDFFGTRRLTMSTAGVIVNEDNNSAIDFRVDGDNADGLLYADVSDETISIGTTTSNLAKLYVQGKAGTLNAFEVASSSGTSMFSIDRLGEAHIQNKLGIGATTSPTSELSIKTDGNSTNLAIHVNNSSNFDVFRLNEAGNAIFGREATQLTATPLSVSFGGTYGNSAEGNAANCKWYLYRDGGATSNYCIAMTASLMSYQAGATGAHAFWVNNGTRALTITSGAFVSIGATSTPQTYLHVLGADTASRMQISVQGTGSTVGISKYDSTNTRIGYWYTTGTVMTISRTSRAFSIDNQFYLTSGGIAGIGTTTPTGGLTVANGAIKNIASDATMVLQTTLNTGYSGANMFLEDGTLGASFQLGNSNASVPSLANTFFMGPRTTTNRLLFTQGPASTVAGGYDSDRSFFWGTSTQPFAGSEFTVFSTGTTTFAVDSSHASRGGCIPIKDADGTGYTYVSGNNGVLTVSTASCI